MKRTTLAGLSVAMILTLLVLAGLTVFRRQVGDAWQEARDYQQMRQDLPEGRRFPQALAAARAQGWPTTAADLQKPLPPSARNAAPIYVRLMQRHKAHPFTKAEEAAMALHPGVTPSAAQWAQIARLLHDRAGEIAWVHQAALRPECVFTHNWATPDPADIKFPELATVRTAAYLLRLESLLMAHQGKYEAAARNQALGFQIGRHGASDGTDTAYLVGIAGDAITLDGLKRLMIMAQPDASLDATIDSLVARDWKPRSASTVLRWETAAGLGEIAHLRQTNGGTSPDSGIPVSPSAKPNPFLDYNGVFLLSEMERDLQVIDGPYKDAVPVMNQVEAQAVDKRHSVRFLAAMYIPSSVLVDKRALIQALTDVTRAGAAVLAQTARVGHPPDRLPLPLTDPYTGKPLGYRREGPQGFVIYSAGADGRFDGGKPGEYSWKPYRVAFRYPGVVSH